MSQYAIDNIPKLERRIRALEKALESVAQELRRLKRNAS